MDNKQMLTILQSIGYPVRYGYFKTPVDPPYLVYNQQLVGHQYGDNVQGTRYTRWQVDLYTDGKRSTQEAAVEAVLNTNRLNWVKISAGVDEVQGYLRTIYEFASLGGQYGTD